MICNLFIYQMLKCNLKDLAGVCPSNFEFKLNRDKCKIFKVMIDEVSVY